MKFHIRGSPSSRLCTFIADQLVTISKTDFFFYSVSEDSDLQSPCQVAFFIFLKSDVNVWLKSYQKVSF